MKKNCERLEMAGCRPGFCLRISRRDSGSSKRWPRRSSRDPDAIHLGIEVYGCIDKNSTKAREDGLGTLAIGRSTFERQMTVDQLAEVSLIGSPEEIRRTVRAYADAGVSHFEIKSSFIRHLNVIRRCCNFSPKRSYLAFR